ncbi:hypothetical protein T07_12071 [Trichinella nelsoni]|uniref:Uncharacterized protein n=1 Tax=Trichinella nelsoni TaxID=6336 RepID=A0A0V0RPR0_9BILA|nr:hypothetical protein T07_12071 [Trichinella nelsoni]
MVVKRVEMSQTAAAFGDDKLLIFLFIGIRLENYYFSLFDQNYLLFSNNKSGREEQGNRKSSCFCLFACCWYCHPNALYLLLLLLLVLCPMSRDLFLSVTLVQMSNTSHHYPAMPLPSEG